MKEKTNYLSYAAFNKATNSKRKDLYIINKSINNSSVENNFKSTFVNDTYTENFNLRLRQTKIKLKNEHSHFDITPRKKTEEVINFHSPTSNFLKTDASYRIVNIEENSQKRSLTENNLNKDYSLEEKLLFYKTLKNQTLSKLSNTISNKIKTLEKHAETQTNEDKINFHINTNHKDSDLMLIRKSGIINFKKSLKDQVNEIMDKIKKQRENKYNLPYVHKNKTEISSVNASTNKLVDRKKVVIPLSKVSYFQKEERKFTEDNQLGFKEYFDSVEIKVNNKIKLKQIEVKESERVLFVITNGYVVTNLNHEIGKYIKLNLKSKIEVFLNEIKIKLKLRSYPSLLFSKDGKIITNLRKFDENIIFASCSNIFTGLLFQNIKLSYDTNQVKCEYNENSYNDKIKTSILNEPKKKQVLIKAMFKRKATKKINLSNRIIKNILKSKIYSQDNYYTERLNNIKIKNYSKEHHSDSEIIFSDKTIHFYYSDKDERKRNYSQSKVLLDNIDNYDFYYENKIINLRKKLKNNNIKKDFSRSGTFSLYSNFPTQGFLSEYNKQKENKLIHLIEKYYEKLTKFQKYKNKIFINLPQNKLDNSHNDKIFGTVQHWLKKVELIHKFSKIDIDEDALTRIKKKNFIKENINKVVNIQYQSDKLVDTNLPDILSLNIPKILRVFPHLKVTELYNYYSNYKSLLKISISINKNLDYLNKGVDFKVFKFGVEQMIHETDEMALSIFNYINSSKSGYLSFDEFVKGMITLNSKYIEDKVNLFFKIIDSDGNGLLSFEEVKELSIKSLKRNIGETNKNADEDETIISLAEYFAEFIFGLVNSDKSDEIPLPKIRQVSNIFINITIDHIE